MTAWSAPFTTKSDLAKREADLVAGAASHDLITTCVGTQITRLWRITPKGLARLWHTFPQPPKEPL